MSARPDVTGQLPAPQARSALRPDRRTPTSPEPPVEGEGTAFGVKMPHRVKPSERCTVAVPSRPAAAGASSGD